MRTLLVTHPGGAHFDEFFGISLILAAHPDRQFIIERRDPTEADLDDPEIWVVDIGGRYQPELKNFDHHQDLSLPASFVLVARYLKLEEILQHYPWWEYKDRMDRFGPYQLARERTTESLIPTISPFEDWFIELFEKSPLSVYQIMKMFGSNIIETAQKLQERLEFWRGSETRIVKDKIVIIGLTDDSSGSQEYRDSMAEPATICVTYDSRGDGWKMYRFNDETSVNFSLIEDDPQIAFAHKGGFIAKTYTRIPLDELMEKIERAIV